MSFPVFCIILASTYSFTCAASIESTSCDAESENYGSCLRSALETSWSTLIKGVPEYDIPPLDPYFTEYSETSYENGEIRGKVVVKNVNTYGFAKAKFLDMRPRLDKDKNHFQLAVDVELPKVFIEGDYKAEGSLGSYKMGGKGYFNISMEDIALTWDMEGHVEDDTLKIESVTVLPTVGKMRIWFSDLFNGNEQLNRAAMYFINEYWSVLYQGMLPYASEQWDKENVLIMNRIFSKISFSQVFSLKKD